jgi:hypothetical protein
VSLAEVVGQELEKRDVEVDDAALFVLMLSIGYGVGRRVHDTPGLLQDDEAMRRIVVTYLDGGTVGSRPPRSQRPGVRRA